MWRIPESLEKPLRKRHQFVKKISKKVLDKGEELWYYSRARPNESEGKSEANLENDTENKRANIKERLAKIPKSETRKC